MHICFNYETDPASGGAEFKSTDVAGVSWPAANLALDGGGTPAYVSAANPVPVTASSLPLPTGAATGAKQDTGNTSLASIDGKITAVNTGAVVVSSSALPTGAATSAKQDSQTTLLAGGLPAALGANGGLKIEGVASGTEVPVSMASAPLPTGAATEATLSTLNGKVTACNTGAVTISAALPAGDNNIGNVDIASAIPAGSNIIGNVRIDQTTPGTTNGVQVAAALPTGTNSIGQVTANAGTNLNTSALALESGGNLAAAATDLAALEALIIGTLRGAATPVIDSYNTITVSAAANTANQQLVAAPGASKQIWIYGLTGTADTADGSIALQDEDNTTITGVMEVSRRGGFVVNPSGNFAMPWKKMVTNKALEIDTVTCGFKGILQYAVVSV